MSKATNQKILANDPRLNWQGAVSLQTTADWTMACRIPWHEQLLYPTELVAKAMEPAGVRISFVTNSTFVAGVLVPQPSLNENIELDKIDICCDGQLVASLPIADQPYFEADNLPVGEKLIELWLPQCLEFRLRWLEIAENATLSFFEDKRPRWLIYGSSITHCRLASSPTQTWPAIVARQKNLNLTCLGFGGQCHLDTMIGRVIRDSAADFVSMCLGINVYGQASLNSRTFRPSVIGFVRLIREQHPDTPVLLISPIISMERENKPNAVGMTLKQIRTEVGEACTKLQAYGDRNLFYLDGLRLLGEEEADMLSSDGLHPHAEGYRRIAKNFLALTNNFWATLLID